MRFSFLILNFNTYNDTFNCVKSIQENINYNNYSIVIVDNGSKNDSYKILEKRYKNENNIVVIESRKNLGFARGNNLGFKYIKNNLDCDFICMINSDTIIEQTDFCNKIIEKYKQYNFDICGFDIILPDGSHSNPIYSDIKCAKDISKRIKLHKYQLFWSKLNLAIINILFNKLRFKLKNNSLDWSKEIMCSGSIQIHGAAIIFSRKYIKNYDGLYDGTFLYFEEVALRYIWTRDNLKVLYTPDIKIKHLESKSTKAILKNFNKRKAFYYENAINSATNLLQYIEKDKSNIWKD